MARILLVEDEPRILEFAQEALTDEGFEVSACATAADARRAFSESKPDLVLLDIGLPDGNGIDLARSLGMAPGGERPFVFLTGQGDLKTRIACFQAGAHDYVQKPFAVEELLARVRVHLGLKRSRDELLARNKDLEIAGRLRQDLTDMIAHDLKAPLTSIKGSLELVNGRGMISDDNYKRLLHNAESAADFMLLMINDLLDIGTAREIGLRAEKSEVSVAPLFVKLRVLFGGRCERRGVRLECHAGDGAKSIRTDPNLLFRILANLIANAVKLSPRGAEVSVESLPQGGKTRFVVSDRGPGVPEAEKTKIFERFSTARGQVSIEDTGTGIGLTFCRLAAQALGGKIWVEDRPGGGSVFILEF